MAQSVHGYFVVYEYYCPSSVRNRKCPYQHTQTSERELKSNQNIDNSHNLNDDYCNTIGILSVTWFA